MSHSINLSVQVFDLPPRDFSGLQDELTVLAQLEFWDALQEVTAALWHGAAAPPNVDTPWWRPEHAPLRAAARWLATHPGHPIHAVIAAHLPEPDYYALDADVLAGYVPADSVIPPWGADALGTGDTTAAGLIAVGLVDLPEGPRVRMVYWPGAWIPQAAPEEATRPAWRPYTLVDGGYDQGVGVRIDLAVVMAGNGPDAIRRFLAEQGQPAGDGQGWPGLELYEGIHRPRLNRYLAPALLDDLDRQLRLTGTLTFSYRYRNT